MASLGRPKYTHDRTHTKAPEARPKGLKSSTFLVTCNPNKVVTNPDSPVYQDLKARLFMACEFVLKKKNIRAMLKYAGPEDPAPPREEWLEKIVAIRDRDAGVEFGTKNKRLHAHMVFVVDHTTKVHVSPEWLRKIVPVFFEGIVKPTSVHINVRGGNARNVFLDYAKKNAGVEEDPEMAFSIGDQEE